MIDTDSERSLVVFKGKGIRRIWNDGQWYFSATEIAGVLRQITIAE